MVHPKTVSSNCKCDKVVLQPEENVVIAAEQDEPQREKNNNVDSDQVWHKLLEVARGLKFWI